MDFESRYSELLSKPKDEELISELIILQEEALTENDADIYLKTSHLLFDTYVNLGDFDLASTLFFTILKENRFEAYKTVLEIIDKLVALLLKTEDFNQLDALLKMRERYLTGTPSQQLMQRFYVAVCQEGLKDYQGAIRTLEAITDNISNNNLVSKYLKLAMLYLRISDLKRAESALERAKIFDKSMKNEMFYLVESDLAFQQENYEDALRQFQIFFVRSKIKTRYLDRYILINIRLHQWGEAWRFYKEYLPKIMRSASKNYRLQFYEAGLVLANLVNDIDEIVHLKERIFRLSLSEEEIIDTFDGIKTLLKFNSTQIRFKSNRDVILETFRVLMGLTDLDRLLYITPTSEGLKVYTYKKSLLMEKIYPSLQWQGTVLQTIIEADLDYHLFVKEDILKQTDYLQKTVFTENTYAYIAAFKIAHMDNTDGFMVAFMTKETQFDYSSKLLFTTKSILESKLSVQRLLDHHETRHRLAERLLAMKAFGLFKIEDGILFMQNDAAKKILSTDTDFMTFEEFQKRFTNRRLYLDDFVGQDHLDFEIQMNQQIKKLSCDLWQIDLTIFMLIEDVTLSENKIADMQLEAARTLSYSLNSMHALKRSIESLKEPATLMEFWIQSEKYWHLSRQEKHQIQDKLAKIIEDSAKIHQIALALDEDGGLLLLLSSVDKRVHQRICHEVTSRIKDYYRHLEWNQETLSVLSGAIVIQKNMTFDSILEKLDYTRDEHTKEFPVYYDKFLIADENIIATLHSQWLDFQNKLNVPLVFNQIGNLLTHKIEFYEVVMNHKVLMGSFNDYQRMLKKHHLIKAEFLVRYHTLLRLLTEWITKTHFSIRFALELPAVILIDPKATEELVKKAKRYKIPLESLVFIVDATIDNEFMIQSLSYLKEKRIKIIIQSSLKDCVNLIETVPSLMDYILIDYQEFNESTKTWFNSILSRLRPGIIMKGVDDPQAAQQLKEAKLYVVKGKVLTCDLTELELQSKLS